MTGNKISIVTVAYNAVSYIEETINSVISQSYDNIEYIVIDGGSTDGTIDLIKNYESFISFWLSESDRGIYDAMNKGVHYATGEYVCFMNCGDKFYNNQVVNKVSSCFCVGADVIYGDTCSIQDIGAIVVKSKPPKYLLTNMPFCHQSSFVRRQCLLDTPFDLNYKYVADYNFFYNCYVISKRFIKTDVVIAIYNAVEGFSAKNKKEVFREVLRIRRDTDTLFSKMLLCTRYYRYVFLEKCKKYFPGIVIAIRKLYSQL